MAAPVVAPLSLLWVGFDLSAVTAAGAGGLLYPAVAGAFGGLMLFQWVNQRYGATPASSASYVLPVVAAVGGVLFLDERITPVMVGGMALIVGGIVVLNRGKGRKREEEKGRKGKGKVRKLPRSAVCGLSSPTVHQRPPLNW